MSFPKYHAYRDSQVDWIGTVPSEWRIAPLKSLARVINGYPFDAAQFDPSEGYPLIRIRDLNQSAPDARYKGEFVEAATIDNDDVLVGMDGEFNVGRWFGEVPALLNQRMCCIRASTRIVTRYLQYVLPTPLKAINDVTYSTTVKHLSSFDVLKIRVAMPPTTSEVQAVVDFLDRETAKIDALVEEQKRLIELLKEKRQAVISQAVTKGLDPNVPMKDSGVEWLGAVPAHWDVVPLMHLTQPDRPIMYGIVLPGPDVGEGVPILKGGNVRPSRLRLDALARTTPEIEQPYARARLRSGDLVYSIRGTIGDCEIVPDELEGCNITQDVARVAPASGVDGVWLRYALLSEPVAQSLAVGSLGAAVRGVNIYDLKRARIPAPPQSERYSIGKWLSGEVVRMDSLVSAAEHGIDLLLERRSALISAAVTGKIDVRGLAPQPEVATA